jgi:hypothetical protein
LILAFLIFNFSLYIYIASQKKKGGAEYMGGFGAFSDCFDCLTM